ncbi:Aste57867_15266 [Aphanomyces stellatus]|uniref:Aste57867_15266 protein n=1 Tax=Aphanomyces stellatus TaxID=120398 RepID=A0A485L4K0_9STRA|nr:hypothetical protein As57867_015210 [Aphanomyces stellatus]VFT92075.1 Aste57867_15266 [Aphanomyces stellatus]
MQICIMIVGTHGDVAPFVGIGKRLQKDGHRVRLATHAVYRGFVENNGLEFYPLGGDPKELSGFMVKTGGSIVPLNYDVLAHDLPKNVAMIDEILHSTWPAVSSPDPEGDPTLAPFRAQAIISNPVTYGHIHVAEKLGVPLHIMFPQPWVPTQEFPHPLSQLPYTGKRQKRNSTSYHIVDWLMWTGTERLVNRFRVEVLGLRKIRKGDGGRSLLLDWNIPHSFMWSEHLVPSPPDWDPELYDVIGTVTEAATVASSYTPSPELKTFLESGAAPIFVGFGSMVIADPGATTKMIVDAAVAAHVRVLIQSSWSDMTQGGKITIPDNVIVIGNCPHDWLMPQMAAVVHHGGAGTTAAGLLAGKPTFIVPFFGDQPFWGWAVERAGVGVHPCPIADLSTEKLTAAFQQLVSREMLAKARALQAKMQREDGIGNAVRSFYRHLPKMQCAFTPEHVATKWLDDDKVAVCDGCAFVLRERTSQPIVDYHAAEYGIKGPASALEGISNGAGAFMHELSGAMKDLVAKPVRGMKEDGLKGAGLGFAKGVGSLVLRPFQGVAQFVDHVAVGAYNQNPAHKRAQPRLDERMALHKDVDLKSTASYVDVSLSPQDKAKAEQILQGLRDHQSIEDIRESWTLTELEAIEESPLSPPPTKLSPDEDEGDDSISPLSEFLHSTSHGTFHMGSLGPDKATHVRRAFSRRYSSQFAVVRDDWEDLTIPLKLQIALLVVGTASDVEAFVAVGKSLVGDGHRVRVAAAPRFREFIQSNGLEFCSLAGNPTSGQEHMATLASGQGVTHETWTDLYAFAVSTWRAVKSQGFRADAIIAHPDVGFHQHLAERLGAPLHLLSGIPYSPTADMPHPLIETMAHETQQNNYFSYTAVQKVLWAAVKDVVNRFRVNELKLEPWTTQFHPAWWKWRIPVSYYWSSLLLSKREDWGDEVDVVGFLQLEDQPPYTPPPALESFLATSGLRRLFVTLPTMNLNLLIAMVEKILDSDPLLQVVIQRIDDDDACEPMFLSDRLVVVDGSVNLTWLFDKIDAVIHQAQDPRMLSLLQQQKPSVAVPVTGIEKQWARHLCEMDHETHLPPVDLEAIAGNNMAFSALVTSLLDRVSDSPLSSSFWSRSISFETNQAVRRTVSSFYKQLPIEAMKCDVLPTKLARVVDTEYNLKLSYEVAYLANKAGSHEILKYTPVQYSLEQLPQVAAKQPINRRRRSTIKDAMMLGGMPPMAPVLGSEISVPSVPIDMSAFWTTRAQEIAFRQRINAAYDAYVASK